MNNNKKDNKLAILPRFIPTTILAALTVFLYVVFLSISSTYKDTFLQNSPSTEHPLRILLTFGLVLAITWIICGYLLPKAMEPKQAWWWFGAFGLIIIGCISITWIEYSYRGTLSDTKLFVPLQIITFLGPVLFLTVMMFYSFTRILNRRQKNQQLDFTFTSDTEGSPDSGHRQGTKKSSMASFDSEHTAHSGLQLLGWTLSVLIMLLAMFAFGLKWHELEHKLTIEWAEIPAILIVFVLAELGIALVIASRVAETNVKNAAEAAKQAADSASDATTALANAQTEAVKTIKSIQYWLESQREPEFVAKCISRGERLKRPDFLHTLGNFTDLWIPVHDDLKDATGKMLGDLFMHFVGTNELPGTVRRTQDAVACVTADAVFANASERWLEETSNIEQGRRLVVWALTTLLPTEFLFPSAYRGQGDLGATRIKSLHQFVSAVMKTCSRKTTEYRRITVFQPEMRGVFNKLAGNPNDTMPCTIDNWFVLDQRRFTQDANGNFDDVRSRIVAKAQLGKENKYDNALNSNILGIIFSSPVAEKESTDTRADIFPYRGDAPEGLQYFDLHPNYGESIAILGSNKARWESMVDGTSLRDVLKKSHWQSIRDWYCTNLHSSPDNTPGAWWVLLNGDSGKLLAPFVFEWDKNDPVTTLDLLLIGSKGDRDEEPTWHGAAISNLSFNRTECTIHLVTKEEKFGQIADAVNKLCNGFKAPDASYSAPIGVEKFGRWQEWPLPDWPAKNDVR